MPLTNLQAYVQFLRAKGYHDAADELEGVAEGTGVSSVTLMGGDMKIPDEAATGWERALDTSTKDSGVVMPHHYGRWDIEPMRFIVENNGPGFLVENATKYLWRYDAKDGHKDLAKAARYLEMLREYENGRPDWYTPYDSSRLPNTADAPLRSVTQGKSRG